MSSASLDINFFFEKILMKHHLRGATHAQPRRGVKEKGDPTYLIVDALTNQKMLTVDDILELKNPNARLAKALVSVRFQPHTAAPPKKSYETAEDLEEFMKGIGLWRKDEIKSLTETEDDKKENKVSETEEEYGFLLREKIFDEIHNDPRYVEAYQLALRKAIAKNIIEAKEQYKHNRKHRTHHEHLQSETSMIRNEKSEEVDHFKAFVEKNYLKIDWPKIGSLQEDAAAHFLSTLFYKDYIQHHSIEERKRIDSGTFMTSFENTKQKVHEILSLKEEEVPCKEPEVELPKDFQMNPHPPQSKNRLSKIMPSQTQEKKKQVLIPTNNGKVTTAAGVMADVEGYRKRVLQNMVEEDKIEHTERRKLRKLIEERKESIEKPQFRDFQLEMRSKSKEISDELGVYKQKLQKLKTFLGVEKKVEVVKQKLESSESNKKNLLLETSKQNSDIEEDNPLLKLTEKFDLQLKAQKIAEEKLSQMRRLRINRAPLKFRVQTGNSAKLSISTRAPKDTKQNTASTKKDRLISIDNCNVTSRWSTPVKPIKLAFNNSTQISPKAHKQVKLVPSYATFKTETLKPLSELIDSFKLEESKRLFKFQKAVNKNPKIPTIHKSLSDARLKRQFMNRVAETYCSQVMDPRKVYTKLEEE